MFEKSFYIGNIPLHIFNIHLYVSFECRDLSKKQQKLHVHLNILVLLDWWGRKHVKQMGGLVYLGSSFCSGRLRAHFLCSRAQADKGEDRIQDWR
jgi:hypothetical protein